MTDTGLRGRRSWRTVAAATLLAGSAVLAFAGAFAAGYVQIHRDVIVPGVSIDGVEIGGLPRDAAEAKLRQLLPDLRAGRLVIFVGQRQFTISYADIGRDYDFAAMLGDAFAVARSGDGTDQVLDHLRSVVDSVEVPIQITLNRDALDERMSAIAASVASQARDATLADSTAGFAVVPSESGVSVDAASAARTVTDALSNAGRVDTTVSIPTTTLAPAVSTETAQAAADRINQISAQPLRLIAGSREIVVAPDELAAWLGAEADGPGDWRPKLDEPAIRVFVDKIKVETDVPVREGTYQFLDGKPVVVPAADGFAVDAPAAAADIYDNLLSRTDGAASTSVTLPTKVVAPSVTTADARLLVAQVTRLSS